MKILIDINHPAHVHYFKNFIKIMKQKGHEFLIISRNKEIEHYLLKKNNIEFLSRGSGSNSIIGKFLYFFKAIFYIFIKVIWFKPDILISFGTPYPAIVSKLLLKTHISINDTEHAKLHHMLTDPFSEYVLTPSCYTKDLGEKQIRFNGYMELCYLHPNYFKPDPNVLKILGVKKDEKYVIMRFVSWNASHDIGHSGLSLEMKRKAVKELSKYAKVFISSESKLPEDLEKYRIKIPLEKMHDALAFASMYFGDGGTMCSEAAVLGIPGILISSSTTGYLIEEEKKYDLIYRFDGLTNINQEMALKKAITLIKINKLRGIWQKKREKLLNDKIDVTKFMVNFVENYFKERYSNEKD